MGFAKKWNPPMAAKYWLPEEQEEEKN